MKVTKEYLRKVIKESIKEAVFSDEDSYILVIDESGWYTVEQGSDGDRFYGKAGLEEAQNLAKRLRKEIDDAGESYEKDVRIFKIGEEINPQMSAAMSTMAALDSISKGMRRKK